MKRFLYTILLLVIVGAVSAQQSITGIVLDDAGPLPGVNITVKGTNIGTTTDFDGAFSIPASQGETLVFSFIGFDNKEVVVGTDTELEINMTSAALQLDDVVVTALGFKEKRDNMSSTYSKIEGDKVVQKGQNKVIDGLAGKASGVRISGASGDPGAGANIQIRGQSTLSGSTQPLIIVDGVPLNNDWIRGQGSEIDAGTSQQSRLNDINPDDIESFQIYKGASAGALFGTRAMNGVIVITTKRGKKGKVNVSLSSSVSIDDITFQHPLQTTFGQGSGGRYSPTSLFSWGDKISERSGGADAVNTDGQFFLSSTTGNRLYPITQKNSRDVFVDQNFDKVFRNGLTLDNKVSVSGGNDKGTFFLSGGQINQDGIIEGTDFNKTNFTANKTQQLTDKLRANAKINYVSSNSNRAQQGSNTAGVYLGLLRNPADFDITDYIGDHYSASGVITGQRQRSYRRYLGNTDNAIYNNPLWTVNEQVNSSDVERFIGTGELVYSFLDNLSLTTRAGFDYYTDNRIYFFPYYTAGADRRYGLLRDETIHSKEISFDALLNYSKRFSDNFGSNFVFGFGLNNRRRKTDFAEADNFISNFRGLYDPAEVSAQENVSYETSQFNRANIRYYGTANFDYADQLFVTLGGAVENHSTLNDVFFYPSVELGWNFHKMLENPGVLSFAKLRASYGQVGNVPVPYREQTFYEVGVFSTFSDGINLADFGGGFQLDERVGNLDLKPEIKTEYEAGIDLRFHRNRISFSATYYQNKIDDVLLDIQLPPSLGFSEIYGNGATIENKGFEVDLGYTFLRNDDWDMGVFVNINTNKNEATRITGDGVISFTPGSSIQSVAAPGQPIGSFYTQDAERNADGSLILNEDGFPIVQPFNSIAGDPNPDWRGGFGFNGSYKGLSVNVLFETTQGNDFAERTRFITSYFGTHADTENEVTLTQDLRNYAGDIVPAGTTVRGNIRDFGAGDVLLDQSYYNGLHGFGDGRLNSFAIADGSWTRLREVSVSYTLRGDFIEKLGLQSVELGASGRNLALWTDIVGADPDVNQFGVGLGQGLDYFTNPGVKSFIFNAKLNF